MWRYWVNFVSVWSRRVRIIRMVLKTWESPILPVTKYKLDDAAIYFRYWILKYRQHSTTAIIGYCCQGWRIDPKGFWVFAQKPKTQKHVNFGLNLSIYPKNGQKLLKSAGIGHIGIRFQPKILHFGFWNSRIFTWDCRKRKHRVPNTQHFSVFWNHTEQQITAFFLSMPVVFFMPYEISYLTSRPDRPS